jgi:hypothetical protein
MAVRENGETARDVPFEDALKAMRISRTPEEIQRSIEANRAELGLAVERLRSELSTLRRWPTIDDARRARRPIAVLVGGSLSAWVLHRHLRGATNR